MERRPRRTEAGDKASRGMVLFRAALERRGWTLADATRELGLSTGVAARWWHGDRRPSAEAARGLSRRLHIPVRYWTAEEPCSSSRS